MRRLPSFAVLTPTGATAALLAALLFLTASCSPLPTDWPTASRAYRYLIIAERPGTVEAPDGRIVRVIKKVYWFTDVCYRARSVDETVPMALGPITNRDEAYLRTAFFNKTTITAPFSNAYGPEHPPFVLLLHDDPTRRVTVIRNPAGHWERTSPEVCEELVFHPSHYPSEYVLF